MELIYETPPLHTSDIWSRWRRWPGLPVMAAPTVRTGNSKLYFSPATATPTRLGPSFSSVRVIQSAIGGGFGGKTIEECNSLICAWVATRVGRPVRFCNSRLDDFLGARSSPVGTHLNSRWESMPTDSSSPKK